VNQCGRFPIAAASALALLVLVGAATAQLPPPAVGSVGDLPAPVSSGSAVSSAAAAARASTSSPAAADAGGGAGASFVSKEATAALAAVAFLDDSKLRAAEIGDSDWITHGRTYGEQRFSPLSQIDSGNVANLRLAWTFFTGQSRGHQATPIAVDGVLFFTASWSIVFAVDARNGAELWRYDPKVPPEAARKACCDVVNRGVAVYKGRIFSASLDGRLFALDAKSGKLLWETVTVDQAKPYTVIGAPRVVKGRVLIGNSGVAPGVRGYLSAYHPDSGEMLWRTYTVPGDPGEGFATSALQKATATWKGDDSWAEGGGGAVADSMAFDPKLDLLYVGTGRGPAASGAAGRQRGESLYTSSILALRPDTGELAWYYQTTPADAGDFGATQQLVLADLTIEGKLRKVLMQASKNGFFYVIDRDTGKLISAEHYVETTWASGVDRAGGRPLRRAGFDSNEDPALVRPTKFGAHDWQPVSFNPQTGLVYFAAQEILSGYRFGKASERQTGQTGAARASELLTPEAVSGQLLAWDPVGQREAWRHPFAQAWNGGTLSTAGNLVFEGSADGRFLALDASSGKELWETRTGGASGAGPITYEVDGKQYVTLVSGWNGAAVMTGADAAMLTGGEERGRVLTYTLAAPASGSQPSAEDFAELLGNPGALQKGERLYREHCAVCHESAALSGGPPGHGLRGDKLGYEDFDAVVRRGLRASKGMPDLGRWLTAKDTRLIKSYLEQPAAETGDSAHQSGAALN